MRTRTFIVPKGKIAAFFDFVNESGLNTQLSGITDEEELVVEVEYDEEDRSEVMHLIELLDENSEEEEWEEKENEEEPEEKPKRKTRKNIN